MVSTVYGRGEMIDVRGRWRPLSRLYDLLGIEPVTTDPTHSIVVVVEAGGNVRCILVDQLLGKQEVVIKSLGEIFRESRYVAGASILGDGRVGLILDPQALVNRETFLLEAAA
jgi:two-component system chemotaxis sensor kinase CheA